MRPTFAEINLRAINTNLRNIRKKIGHHSRIMAVVKANAYGHGVIPVVESIRKNKTAEYFGVAIVEEGVAIRQAGITEPIHVFTAPNNEQLELYLTYHLDVTLCDLETAKKLNQLSKKKKNKAVVQIKIDTGMGRIGVPAKNAVDFVKKVSQLSHIEIKGIWTHFASSDERDLSFANEQLSLFRSIVTQLELEGIHIPLIHCANSGAILQLPESYFDMVRPGIMMYGYAPSLETKKTVQIFPALSLKAKVGFVKVVEKGTSISYNRRYYTKRKTTIISITVGYADGYFRNLTNKSHALIKGKKYPIVGTVCMDQVMIDVGTADVKVGDSVVLIGKSGSQQITGWDISRAIGTIPYEVTCAVSQRIPRKYING